MLRRIFLTTSIAAIVALAFACGNDSDSQFGDGSKGADGGPDGTSPIGTFDNVDGGGSGSACGPNGKACGDAGVCAGDTCCEATRACGDSCCATDNVCSFAKCVAPGAECHDSSDCADNQYCEYSLGTTTVGSDASACFKANDRTGKCLPRPPECAAGAPADETCLQKCEVRPPTTTFTMTQKQAWGGEIVEPFSTDVMMAPIVIQLDDDDCDGKITERDIPEIVFSTFANHAYHGPGKLHAISIVNGAFVDKWTVPNAQSTIVVDPSKHIAGGNFDGQPGNEIVACGTDGKVHAFRGTDGAPLWESADAMLCFMPSIADLDGDGNVEVIVEGGILNGADGTLKFAFNPPLPGPFVVSDIDGDGQLDVVTAAGAYNASGQLFVATGLQSVNNFSDTGDWKGPWAAIGDFDNDGKPEVVSVDNLAHTIAVWRYDANVVTADPLGKFTIVRQPTDMNALFAPGNACPGGSWGATHGGGPPTVADFNHDGVPDVALAGGIGYVVFDGKKLVDPAVAGSDAIMWSKVTTDCSSASTGSTVFDFDGDGKAEVVYSDEHRLRIYDGATGDELASICNTTATLSEFPLVADVDNDGQADIIVVANGYGETCDDGTSLTRQAGVRVFGPASGSWVRTRRVWNEHAYHITNVEEDGTIPKKEAANWTQKGLNNFRQNKQPGSEFAAPNLVATIAAQCQSPIGVTITVRNVGEALVPKGVVVGVYSNGAKIGSVTTTRPLYPAEGEPLDFPFTGSGGISALVDDGAPPHPNWTECRTDDNRTADFVPTCGVR